MVVDIEGSPLWLARLAKLVSLRTLVWLGIEGTIGVVARFLAGSIALVLFGLELSRVSRALSSSGVAERLAQKWVQSCAVPFA
jgi:hypothetical protein